MNFDFKKDLNYIAYFASIYQNGAFYIFGGDGNSNKIGRLDEVSQTWSLAGNLKSGRYGHGVIFDGSSFLVIGGDGTFKTEKCILVGTTMSCTELESPPLGNYAYYPALFLTDKNYGDDC